MRALPPLALSACLVLTGCIGAAVDRVSGSGVEGPVVPIRLDSGGIEPLGTGLRIDFGRDGPGVIETVSRLQGDAPDRVFTTECGSAGVSAAQWQDGLMLVFRNGAFAGWRVPDATRSATGALWAGVACAGA